MSRDDLVVSPGVYPLVHTLTRCDQLRRRQEAEQLGVADGLRLAVLRC